MATQSMPVGGMRPVDSAGTGADLVVRNAKIYTGDPAHPAATAVAIKDGVFVAVGGDAQVARHIRSNTRIIDALNRRAIPGLNDSHTHVIRGGNNYLMELRWDGVRSLRRALQMLREQAGRTPKGQWVRVVGGWTPEQFAEKRLPTLKELNAAAPDTPVFVMHLYQSALMNKAALTAVGYTRESPNPPGGEIVRDRSGEPTGLLLAAPGASLLYSTLSKGPILGDEQKLESTRHFFRELNRFGLTSAIDAAGGFQDFPGDYGTVMQLAQRGELSIRIAYHLFPQTAGQELDDLRRWIGMVKPGDGDQWLRANGAGENLAWSPADFENFAEPRPQLRESAAADLEAAARLLIENDWGFRLHATYDETIRHDLDVFEKIAKDAGGTLGVPWMFDHAETISDNSIDRVKALGGNVAIQNRMYFQGAAFENRYGRTATEWAPPVTKLLAAGLTVGAGTDATRVSSYNPWLSLHWLTTGTDIGGSQLYSRENIVDRATALELYTVAGAKLSGEADQKGTIEVGKYADLAILSADYFTVADSAIPDIEAELTIAGGRIVYASDEYEGQDDFLEAPSIEWSPVAHFGGYQGTPSGVRQANGFVEASADAAEQRAWRERRGEHVHLHSHDPLEDH
ncbi:amidohydrolase [Diaminobutyricibacter tongyongensis]|uniref:Amidohydrolase n=1 Tax=Leifsonia tongyongensis TaxID=1268043 RepID=A0A6L9XUP4_9MICO|nr:amidohydrolase [Diaminobutyricibacter tongyongensis]NEN05026.1 amidohydrolase [Diaminobutyricibacter tongyongensis]